MSCERCRPKRPSPLAMQKMVNDWNKKHAQGIAVKVKKDNGVEAFTVTTSEAWMLGGHTPVIMLRGISGCYALERVTPI